jgi:hypothetical protein
MWDYAKSKGIHVTQWSSASPEPAAELVSVQFYLVTLANDLNRNMSKAIPTLDGFKAYANGIELREKHGIVELAVLVRLPLKWR